MTDPLAVERNTTQPCVEEAGRSVSRSVAITTKNRPQGPRPVWYNFMVRRCVRGSTEVLEAGRVFLILPMGVNWSEHFQFKVAEITSN